MLEYILIGINLVAVIAVIFYYNKRMDKMANALQTLQDMASQIGTAADSLQALVTNLKSNQLTPAQIIDNLQPELDKLNTILQQAGQSPKEETKEETADQG